MTHLHRTINLLPKTPSALSDKPPVKRRLLKLGRCLGLACLTVFLLGLVIPEQRMIPVVGATSGDWHPRSFWYYPWGHSVVHKGLDIFARRGVPVVSATGGLVIRSDDSPRGGKNVVVLGPKWRFHYYAHLDRVDVSAGQLLSRGQPLGAVGNSGNARGKACHLHYSIVSPLPLPWNIRSGPRGWQRMFFVDPGSGLGS